MSQLTDPAYLLGEQYRNATNLGARMQLHERFSTNPTGWQRWVFDQLALSDGARILELGCGPGKLWLENCDRVPASWELTLSDFSPGMVEQAKENLSSALPSSVLSSWHFEVINAQAIPYADGSFDAVIANHMLYHVPDRARALSEIRRVLKHGARFFAATNGAAHMQEVWSLIERFAPDSQLERPTLSFILENGAAELAAWFGNVELRRYEDALVVTEVEPLVGYVLSGLGKRIVEQEQVEQFAEFLAQEMQAHNGAIFITKDSGLFVAQ